MIFVKMSFKYLAHLIVVSMQLLDFLIKLLSKGLPYGPMHQIEEYEPDLFARA